MSRSRLADLVGAGLALAVAVSVVVSFLVNGEGNPWPALVTLGSAAIAYAAGRLLAPLVQAVAVLVVGAFALTVAFTPFVWLVLPGGPPLGYGNANAALYVQTTALAAIAALAATNDRWRTLWLLAAGGFLLLTAGTQSLAALLTGLAVPAALFVTLTGTRPPRRVLAIGCLSVVLMAHLTALGLGSTYRPDGESSFTYAAVESSLSERRLALWSDAVSLAAAHPLDGVGPREFPEISPTAQITPDTRETHSGVLQMAAETGWAGAAALLCLLLWASIRPLLAPGEGGVTGHGVVAATAATALAVHVSVDYVLSFPVVVAMAALVLGAGTGRSGPAPAAAHQPGPSMSPGPWPGD